MRKGQKKILEAAKTLNFSEEKISLLSREDLTINQLNIYYKYLCRFPQIRIDDVDLYVRKCDEFYNAVTNNDLPHLRLLFYQAYNQYAWTDTLYQIIMSEIPVLYKVWIIAVAQGTLPTEEVTEFVLSHDKLLKDNSISGVLPTLLSNAIKFYKSEYLNNIVTLLDCCTIKSQILNLSHYLANDKAILSSKMTSKKFVEIGMYLLNHNRWAEYHDYIMQEAYSETYPLIEQLNQKILTTKHEYHSALQEKFNSVIQSLEALKQPGSLYTKVLYPYITCETKLSSTGIEFVLRHYDSVILWVEDGKYMSMEPAKFRYVKKDDTKVEFRIILFYDGAIYKKRIISKYLYKAKCTPLTLREAFYCLHRFGDYAKEILTTYYRMNAESGALQTVVEELIRYTNDKTLNNALLGSKVLPPMNCNEFIGHSSLNSIMKDKYKGGQDINWNRVGVKNGYAVMKAIPLLDSSSKTWLYNELHNLNVPDITGKVYSSQALAIELCSTILIAKMDKEEVEKYNMDWEEAEFDWEEGELQGIIKDYIRMAHTLHKKVSLKQTSIPKIIEKHNELAIQIRNKHVDTLKIPKKSKFNKLREMLPDEFEWITTKKRLIEEGTKMRHCVASYDGCINRDESAIYSFVFAPEKKRYTLEFKKNKATHQYYLAQMQSACDRGASKKAREYVNSFLGEKVS